MEYCVSAIPGVTGFSPEMMGMTDRTQAGVVEMQRKQQGMVLLAGFFNSLRRYRKEQGRLMLWMIQTFISDGRLIRIGGPDSAQFVPLVRDKLLGEYDVVVDDTPSSPNMKERVWSSLVQIGPMMTKIGVPPEIYLDLLEYSPLPATLVAKIKKRAEDAQKQQQNQPPPDPKTQSEVAKNQAHAQHFQALAQETGARTQLDVARTQADIESKKALAIAALAKVGMSQDQMALQQADQAMQALLGAHQAAMTEQGQAHDQAVAQHQAQLAAQQQAHQQQMDMAQHGLAQQQAEQAAQQPQGGGE
jgi:hypothetical protein